MSTRATPLRGDNFWNRFAPHPPAFRPIKSGRLFRNIEELQHFFRNSALRGDRQDSAEREPALTTEVAEADIKGHLSDLLHLLDEYAG